MRCSSLSLPCIINDRGYEIGEKFKLYNYMDKHMDYEVKINKAEAIKFYFKKPPADFFNEKPLLALNSSRDIR